MYARVTAFQMHSDKIGDVEERMDGIRDRINGIAGLIDVTVCWNDDGQGITTAVYEDQASADAAASQIQEAWGSLADALAAPPSVTTYSTVHRLT